MICEQDLCSLHQVSVQDPHERSPGKISVQDLYKSSAGKISVRDLLARYVQVSIKGLLARPLKKDLYKRSLGKICKLSKKCLLARFMYETSWQDLCNRSLCNVFVQGFHKRRPGSLARSPYKISKRGLLARLLKRSLYKLSIRALLARSL